MSKEAMKLQEIMEQAQVFASAWSLVGGRFDGGNAMDDAEVAKNELRQMVEEALAKQEQGEPVAWIEHHKGGCNLNWEEVNHPYAKATPLYTTQQQRKPMTDEQMWNLWNSQGSDDMTQKEAIAFARAIEAAHGIKE